jgi:hypothetical protein
MCTPRGNLTSPMTGTGHGVDALGSLYIPLQSYTAPKLPKLSRTISMSAYLTAERAVRGSLLSVALTHLSSELVGAIAADGSVQLGRVAFSIRSSVPVDAFHIRCKKAPIRHETETERRPSRSPAASGTRTLVEHVLRDALQITYS